ncbi:MAG TPA: nucleotidyltransferase [Candidatus Hydrogenedentes bacterium]|nr:nucleotidyltransferase [Candidatus Hydrogenedentota bacterium]HIJ72970.1 nucleotidyltransferase [Candidatus Hydrogenedentota bacterium]
MSVHIEIPREEIEAFCRRWEIVELAFFGSVLRDDFGPDSDVDILVRFRPEARHTLFDMVTMEEDLKEILGREADLIERTAIERSRNYIRRDAILRSAEVIYAA